jgi:hypothetical protein
MPMSSEEFVEWLDLELEELCDYGRTAAQGNLSGQKVIATKNHRNQRAP